MFSPDMWIHPVCNLSFQHNFGMLASSSWDGIIKVLALQKEMCQQKSTQHALEVNCIACRLDGNDVFVWKD